MITIEFTNPSITIPNPSGYCITAMLKPQVGLQDQLYVYVATTREASNKLAAVAFDATAGPRVGDLMIQGDGRDYTFQGAKLISVHANMTRRVRSQILEFQVDFHADPAPTVTLSNQETFALNELNTLRNDFDLQLDGGAAEHLLGFAARQSATGEQVFRFTTPRSSQNSWIETLLEWHDAILQDSNADHSVRVGFSQAGAQPMVLDRNTTSIVYASEAFGCAIEWKGLAMRDICSNSSGQLGARLPLWELPLDEVVLHEEQAQDQFRAPVPRPAVEVGTVLFRAGHHHDLAIV